MQISKKKQIALAEHIKQILIEQQSNPDTEDAHDVADDNLCVLLMAVGFEDVVDEYYKIKRWFLKTKRVIAMNDQLEYIVVEGTNHADGYHFQIEVNEKIKEGYVPIGNMAISADPHGHPAHNKVYWCQAMVLKDNSNDE